MRRREQCFAQEGSRRDVSLERGHVCFRVRRSCEGTVVLGKVATMLRGGLVFSEFAPFCFALTLAGGAVGGIRRSFSVVQWPQHDRQPML